MPCALCRFSCLPRVCQPPCCPPVCLLNVLYFVLHSGVARPAAQRMFWDDLCGLPGRAREGAACRRCRATPGGAVSLARRKGPAWAGRQASEGVWRSGKGMGSEGQCKNAPTGAAGRGAGRDTRGGRRRLGAASNQPAAGAGRYFILGRQAAAEAASADAPSLRQSKRPIRCGARRGRL